MGRRWRQVTLFDEAALPDKRVTVRRKIFLDNGKERNQYWISDKPCSERDVTEMCARDYSIRGAWAPAAAGTVRARGRGTPCGRRMAARAQWTT